MASALRSIVVNPAEGRPRAGWRLLGQTVVFLVVLVVVELVALVVGAEGIGPGGTDDPLVFLVAVLPAAVATAVSVGVAARLLDRRPVRDLGLRLDRTWWRDLVAGLVLGAALMAAIFTAQLAAGWLVVTGWAGRDPAGAASSLAGALVLFVVVGVYEEVLTRGYHLANVAQGLRGLLGARGAVVVAWVVTSAVFGLLHAANPAASATSTTGVALAGGFLGLGVVLTGSLALPIGAHVAWNLVQGPVLGMPVSGNPSVAVPLVSVRETGPDRWTGGAFGPEAGLVGLVALAVGCLATLWWVRRTRGGVGLAVAIAAPPDRRGGPIRFHDGGDHGTISDDVPVPTEERTHAVEHQGPEGHEPGVRPG